MEQGKEIAILQSIGLRSFYYLFIILFYNLYLGFQIFRIYFGETFIVIGTAVLLGTG
jgi:hypothetical protein